MEIKTNKEFKLDNYPLSDNDIGNFYKYSNPFWGINETYIKYLDSQSLFVNVYCDPDGIDWYTDLCGVPVAESKNRQDAERLGIIEAFETLEQILKDGK